MRKTAFIAALLLFLAVFGTFASAENFVKVYFIVSGSGEWKGSEISLECVRRGNTQSLYRSSIEAGNEYSFYVDKDMDKRIWCRIETSDGRVMFTEVINVTSIVDGGRYNVNYELPPKTETGIQYAGFEEVESMMDTLNDDFRAMPDLFGLVLGNEKMNFYVGDDKLHGTTKRNVLISMGYGEMSGESVHIFTDDAVLEKLKNDQLSIATALRNNEIRFEGVGILNWIRFSIFRLIFDISSFFGSL